MTGSPAPERISPDQPESKGPEQMDITCTICGNPSTRKTLRYAAADQLIYDVYWCDLCALGAVRPLPSKKESQDVHSPGNYRTETGGRFNPVVEWLVYQSRLARKRRIKQFIRHGSILDIGCGRGLFLDIMKKDGWTVTGTEVTKNAALAVTETYGIRVLSGDPSSWGLQEDSFDVITMSHVLEHLHHPARMLDLCQRLLKTDGILLCSTPNSAGLQAKFGKDKWFHLDIPHHVFFFSETGLVGLLRKHGFAIKQTRRFDLEYDPFGWLQTLLNLTGIRRDHLYSLLKDPALRKQELTGQGIKDTILTVFLAPIFLPFAVVLSLVDSFVLKQGGSLEITTVKETKGVS